MTLQTYPAFFVLSYSGLGRFPLVHLDPGPVLNNTPVSPMTQSYFLYITLRRHPGWFQSMLTPRERAEKTLKLLS
jgi:hypothetical protein